VSRTVEAGLTPIFFSSARTFWTGSLSPTMLSRVKG
jgi:hypothetical protein